MINDTLRWVARRIDSTSQCHTQRRFSNHREQADQRRHRDINQSHQHCLALTAGSPVAAGTIVLDGGMISNATVIKATNSFVVGNCDHLWGPIFDMGNSAATWICRESTALLSVSNTIQGSGTFIGDLIQAPGAAISPGGHGGVAGTLACTRAALGGNVTLNAGALQFDLSNSGTAGNDQLTVGGTLTLNATNDVHLNSGGVFDAINPYTLITAGSLGEIRTTFELPVRLRKAATPSRLTQRRHPIRSSLSVAAVVPRILRGSEILPPIPGTEGAQPTGRAADRAEQFFSLDAVTFNDVGAALPAVTLAARSRPVRSLSITPSRTIHSPRRGRARRAFNKARSRLAVIQQCGQQQFRRTCYRAGAVSSPTPV